MTEHEPVTTAASTTRPGPGRSRHTAAPGNARPFSARPGTGWMHALVTALEQVPTAILLTSEAGEIVEANAAARRLLDARDGLAARGNRLCLARAGDQRRLMGLLAATKLAARPFSRAGGLAVHRPSGSHPYYLMVSPLKGTHGSSRPFIAKLDVTDVCVDTTLDEHLLRELFQLTPRECELAQALAEGATPARAAERMGIRPETVRSHLKQLFQKTRTSRQAELVRVLLLGALHASAVPREARARTAAGPRHLVRAVR